MVWDLYRFCVFFLDGRNWFKRGGKVGRVVGGIVRGFMFIKYLFRVRLYILYILVFLIFTVIFIIFV